MLETEKNIQIQKDIIEILNDQTTIISTKTLKELLGYSSPNTILAVCKDLQEILKNLYPDGSVLLTINHNGVELIRNFVSLEELYQKFNQSELLFEIFAAVFFNEELLVADFCQIHGVSESTLARKIRLINDSIKEYDLRIIFSSRMRLKGNEVKRRLLFYTFLNAFSSQAADQLSAGEISRCIRSRKKSPAISIWICLRRRRSILVLCCISSIRRSSAAIRLFFSIPKKCCWATLRCRLCPIFYPFGAVMIGGSF